MAQNLAECVDCGGKVSRHANSCPHCGRPFGRPRRKSTAGQFLVLLVVIGFGAIVVGRPSGPPRVKTEAEKTEDAQRAARIDSTLGVVKAVRQQLRDPDSLKVHQALSSVDGNVVCVAYGAKNGFGGMVREQIVMQFKPEFVSKAASAWNKRCAAQKMFDMTPGFG